VHRLIQGKYHRESSNYEDGSRLEATFYFAASPQPGANSSPIRRCFIGNNSAKGDFPSRSSNCEGQGSPTGYHAYSYPSNVGARPVYRCRVGTDHFLSRASNCEGQVNEGLLG